MLPLKAAVDLVRPLVLGQMSRRSAAAAPDPDRVCVQRLLSGAGAHPAPVLPLAACREPPGADRPALQARPSPRPRRLVRRCTALRSAAGTGAARGGALQPARAADDFLEPEKAFRFSARGRTSATVEVVRRSRPATTCTASSSSSPPRRHARARRRFRPARSSSTRPSRRTSRPIATSLRIRVPVEQAPAPFWLARDEPGLRRRRPVLSADAERRDVGLAAFGGAGSARVAAAAASPSPAAWRWLHDVAAAASSDRRRRSTARHRRRAARRALLAVVGAFFVAGLAAVAHALRAADAADPVVDHRRQRGEHGVARPRRCALAASYSLGMALVYTALGVAAGLAGEGLAAALQNPWVLGAFALGAGRAVAVDVRRLRAALPRGAARRA